MAEDRKKRYAIRIAPCSSYDVGRMESWLEYMAQKGYILDKMIAGMAVFRREEPQKLRYRMCELPQDSLYEDKSPSSQQELISICQASGWNFIAERGAFGIFATADNAASELQTEPWIDYDKALLQMGYALFLAVFCGISCTFADWRWRLGIAAVLLLPIFYWGHKKKIPRVLQTFMCVMLIALPGFYGQWSLYLGNGFFITWINEGSGVFVSALLRTLFFIFFFFYVLAGPFQYCLRMQRGISVDHSQNWRWKAPVYRVTSVGVLVIFTYMFMTMFNGCTAETQPTNLQRWEQYNGTVPFALLEDFVPQSVALEAWNDTTKVQFDEQRQRTRDVPAVFYNWRASGSHIEEKPDWLAPQVYYLQQEGTLRLIDGQQLQGSLSVIYYETHWPWIARALAREYEHLAQKRLGEDYQILALPELDVDYALAYSDAQLAEPYPRLLLVDGNCMAKVYFYQNPDGYTVSVEQWSQIFAAQLGK